MLAAPSRVLPRPDWRSLLPRPETLLRWHRELVRRKWAAYRRRPGRQRPVVRGEFHDLILKLASENEGWETDRPAAYVFFRGKSLVVVRAVGPDLAAPT